VHRVVITAVLLAAKFFDDAYYNNAYYAKVGGVLTPEINGLEVDFLFRINFSLYVTTDEFDKYRSELLTHLASVSTPMIVPQTPQSQFYGSAVSPKDRQKSPHNISPQYNQLQQLQQHHHAPQHHDILAVAAATAALSGQVVIQQNFDRHQQQQEQQHHNQMNHTSSMIVNCNNSGNGLGMFHNDVISDNFVLLTSQITPSPPYPPIDSMDSNPLINSLMNTTIATTEDANNNAIIQSLEFLQQSFDSGSCDNSNGNNISIGFGPVMTRTHSLPLKLDCGISSSQYYDPTNCAILNHTNATTFSNVFPQSCSVASLPTMNAQSYSLDEQYLRLLVENTHQQIQHPSQSQSINLHHQQQQQHMNLVYEDDIFHCQHSMQQQQYQLERYNQSRMNDTTMPATITVSSSPSGAYSNMLALQHEARRIAATQSHMLATAGLSGPGF
jgi:Cyclin